MRGATILALGLLVANAARAEVPALDQTIPAIVAQTLPSVVNIAVWSTEPASTGVAGRKGEFRAYGSGLIVRADGIILTNRHVIQGATSISVVLQDHSRLRAQVIEAANLIDLALLKVDAGRPLPVLQFADSDTLQIGQTVLAVGNPLGVGTSVTSGIVSAINRSIMNTPFDDFVQTDAAINHGNSGGPLIDTQGRVVGINTLLRAPTGSTGSVGVGFAIPSNDVAFVVSRLLGPGPKMPGWIGVHLEDTTPEMAEAFGLQEQRGAVITAVTPDGPAAHAGLQPGDIILRTADQENVDAQSILHAAARTDIGDALDLLVWSRGHKRMVPVRVALWPEPADAGTRLDNANTRPPPGLGLTFAPLTPDLRRRYALPQSVFGVVLTAVDAHGEGRDGGLRVGDVVERVQRSAVRNASDVEAVLDRVRAAGRNFVMLLVHRQPGEGRENNNPTWIPLALGAAKATAPPRGPVVRSVP